MIAAAASMIAEALGCSPNPKSIEQAIQKATPEQIVELKKIDKDFEVKMKELDVDLYSIQTKDIQDAEADLLMIGHQNLLRQLQSLVF